MNYAVIVAAGQSRRMGKGANKLFLPLAGRPVVVHTWACFDAAPEIAGLVLVIQESQVETFHQFARQYHFTKPYQCIPGGPERQDSVWNGLIALPEDAEFVLIQDAARPATPLSLITGTLEVAYLHGAAVAAQLVTDTIKSADSEGFMKTTLDRSQLRSVQTPQTFRVDVIKRAISAARARGLVLTDDTAACELIGQPVKLVADPRPNPKVTTPEDLPYLEWLLTRARKG